MKGLRGFLALFGLSILGIALERVFPGSPWPFVARMGFVVAVMTIIIHVLAGHPQPEVTVDPPVAKRGGKAEVAVGFRGRVPGFYGVSLSTLGRMDGARRWEKLGRSEETFLVEDLPRGEHRIFARVSYQDPLGLFHRMTYGEGQGRIVVRPQTVDADPRALMALVPRPSGGAQPNLDAQEPAGARPYRPGDRLVRIHWPQTARTGEVRVKETWRRGPGGFLIVLDTRRSSYLTEEGFEQAVSVAASLSISGVRRAARLDLVAGKNHVSPDGSVESDFMDVLTLVRFGEVTELSVPSDLRGAPAIVVSGSTASQPGALETAMWVTTEPTGARGWLEVPDLPALSRMSRLGEWAL